MAIGPMPVADTVATELDQVHERARYAYRFRGPGWYVAGFAPDWAHRDTKGRTYSREQIGRQVQGQVERVVAADTSFDRERLTLNGVEAVGTGTQTTRVGVRIAIAFALRWRGGSRTNLEGTTRMFSRLDTLILRVHDLSAARTWYAATLGLTAVYVDEAEGLAVLGLEGTSLTLWQLKPGEAMVDSATAPYPIFSVADAAAAQTLLRERGTAAGALQVGPGVRFFSFRDLDGNRLEACEVLAT